MAGTGGARPGAGRKTKAAEAETRDIACNALIEKFGSKEEAFKWLVESKEASLVKFAFEHAFGKPVETVKHSGEISGVNLIFQSAPNCQPITDDGNNTNPQ
jgi:hypothetical protein